jgi:hypothetical protein
LKKVNTNRVFSLDKRLGGGRLKGEKHPGKKTPKLIL